MNWEDEKLIREFIATFKEDHRPSKITVDAEGTTVTVNNLGDIRTESLLENGTNQRQ